jgi:hypothetical protein
MGYLSTGVVIFSFEALLSTGLSCGYSQGLIHRKTWISQILGTENPLKQGEICSALDEIKRKEETDRLESRPL